MDGLGALILSPTRELALQIFEVLKKIGKYHNFSAGLLIGGKDLKTEKERVGKMNILVATPGRLLQHMDENVELRCENLQFLGELDFRRYATKDPKMRNTTLPFTSFKVISFSVFASFRFFH